MASDLKPRLCCMIKSENGYGFHLHGEKGKSGQYIRKVEPASPAEAAGLRAGDRVIEVNGENVERETHQQVVQRIKGLDHETRLLVVDRETDEYLRSLRLTCTEDMAIRICPSTSSSSPLPTPNKRENGSMSKVPSTMSSEITKPSRRSPSRAAKKHSSLPPRDSLCHALPTSSSECGRVLNILHISSKFKLLSRVSAECVFMYVHIENPMDSHCKVEISYIGPS